MLTRIELTTFALTVIAGVQVSYLLLIDHSGDEG